ncbi:MAG TPA: hypothetical protein VMF53_03670 [Alphaproteobacteria bacterium]|nr:hypothetical protein [Alphaproteobacteria bacterium]
MSAAPEDRKPADKKRAKPARSSAGDAARRAREERLADALRRNLKRRKEDVARRGGSGAGEPDA